MAPHSSNVVQAPTGPRVLLLTGEKGVGKSTLLREVINKLRCEVAGFVTEPVLDHDHRVGYRMIDLCTGKEATIAQRVPHSTAARGGPFVVNHQAFEVFGAALVREASRRADLIVMDEIGCMEQGAPLFQEAVRACLASGKPVICVVQAAKCAFVEELLATYRTEVVRVSAVQMEKTRGLILERVRKWGLCDVG
ncbi:MAG: nucleoside-triphosphatase [candidate division KSB1 bacterium]|nr:nucleoside-triphosphatase [candidate division KSB1 bacterium]